MCYTQAIEATANISASQTGLENCYCITASYVGKGLVNETIGRCFYLVVQLGLFVVVMDGEDAVYYFQSIGSIAQRFGHCSEYGLN